MVVMARLCCARPLHVEDIDWKDKWKPPQYPRVEWAEGMPLMLPCELLPLGINYWLENWAPISPLQQSTDPVLQLRHHY